MGSKGRAEAGVLWWWRDGACCGNKQPETEINPASVICRQLPLFVPHQIGRFRPLPRTHDFIICLGGKLTHFGSLIPNPSPLFFFATKVPRDGACQLGGPGWAQTPKCGGPGGLGSFGDTRAGFQVARCHRGCTQMPPAGGLYYRTASTPSGPSAMAETAFRGGGPRAINGYHRPPGGI